MAKKKDKESIKLDIPEVARDKAGIPMYVFQDQLKDTEHPTLHNRALEVVLLWRESVISVGHYNTPRSITIGEDISADFRVACDGLPVDAFTFVEPSVEGGFTIAWTDSLAVEVRDERGIIRDNARLKADDMLESDASHAGILRHRYKLQLHDRLAMQAGEVTFVIQYVSPVRVIPTTFLSSIDYYFTKILGLTALAHLFLILALIFTPKSPTTFDDDLFQNPNRFAKLMLIEQEAPPPKKFEVSGKEGAKHKDEEGKFGKPEKEKKDALASVNGAPKIDPNKREKDRKIALSSGIFAALGDANGNDAASDTFGPGGLGGGINNALGGLRGTAMGDAGGSGGMGARGFGSGGGGSSLGVGGFGGGTGRGTGGSGTVNLGGRGKDAYSVVSGRVDTEGCLTQQQVLRVVSRALSQGRYCYEQEIGRNPNLAGKVVSSFTVGPTGAVIEASVRESTMNNEAVETCLTRVVQRLRFPPCAGGGTAEVTYPWLFTRGGG